MSRRGGFAPIRSALAAGLLLIACQGPAEPEDIEGIKIGALLPFTGELAASGASEEQAIRLAIETINQAGGISGQALVLSVQDTHSSLTRGRASAASIFRAGVSGLLGPDETVLAREFAPALGDHAAVMISGGISARAETALEPSRWFRIFPSAKTVTAGLAARMLNDGISSATIVYVDDSYGRTFADFFAKAFTSLGAEVQGSVAIAVDSSRVGLPRGNPEALVLVAYPRAGALVVNELAAAGFSGKWYFAPSLDSEEFLLNTLPAELEGAVGISPALTADSAEFEPQFRNRWRGAPPSLNAHFYYDSAAVLAFALAEAQFRLNRKPNADELASSVRAVAGPPGTTVTWKELPTGLRAVQSGMDINYRGLSGAIDFDKDGDVPQGLVRFWHVESGAIVRE